MNGGLVKNIDSMLNFLILALASVAQWIERQPVNQKLAGSIPCQGTCLGCGPGPWLGVSRRQPINASLPLVLPAFPSL